MGFGVKGDGLAKEKLKPLSKKYIKYRKKNQNKLNELTTSNKSNLTFSRQMINSLYGSSAQDLRGQINIKDARRATTNSSKIPTNSDLVKWNEEKGRPFFYISDLEQKRLEQKMSKDLNSALKKSFK